MFVRTAILRVCYWYRVVENVTVGLLSAPESCYRCIPEILWFEQNITPWHSCQVADLFIQPEMASLFADTTFVDKDVLLMEEKLEYFPCLVTHQIGIEVSTQAADQIATRGSGTVVIKTYRHLKESCFCMTTKFIIKILLVKQLCIHISSFSGKIVNYWCTRWSCTRPTS